MSEVQIVQQSIGRAFIPCEPFETRLYNVNTDRFEDVTVDGYDVRVYPLNEETSAWSFANAIGDTKKHVSVIMPRVSKTS